MCYSVKCYTCDARYDSRESNHRCFVQKISKAKLEHLEKQEGINYYFDLETKKVKDVNGCDKFEVNCACIVGNEFEVLEDGSQVLVARAFVGNNSMSELCDFIFFKENSLLQRKKHVKIFAHNGGRFDYQLLLREYFERAIKAPKIIWDGSTIKEMRLGRLIFMDTRLYINAPLRDFPKMFNTGGFQKGHFPHLFNLTENEDYVGPIPDRIYFDVKEKDKEEFEVWYNSWTGRDDWDFFEQLASYCLDDCLVLMQGFEKFSNEFKLLTGIKPGTGNCTTAGAANQVWRSKFLANNTVGVVKEQGYDDIQSRKALRYLHWLSHYHFNDELQFSGNEGEKKIKVKRDLEIPLTGGQAGYHTVHSVQSRNVQPILNTKYETFKLDGYHELTNTAIEFYGCLYHGCSNCYDPDTESVFDKKKMGQLLKECVERKHKLESTGLNIIEMWECEWDKLCATDARIQRQLVELGLDKRVFNLDPTTPRQCLFGGRTENTCLYS